MIDSNYFNTYQAPKNLLQNHTIAISGATSGIGRTVALSCAQHGATVVLLGRNMKKLEKVYDEIEHSGGPEPAIYKIDFTDTSAKTYHDLRDALASEFGHIDGLLNNAAELGTCTPIAHYSEADWQQVIQVNVNAPFMLTKALLPLLQKASAGRILFTLSGVAEQGRAYWGAYAASKAANLNLMQTLADELEASNVRVNAINPGPTRTNMRANAYPAENPNNVLPPEALTNRYLFLLGENGLAAHGEIFEAQP